MHIPFNGEPLAGLQVLGILETRTLDFENVILLSANEGILPKAADMPSFIPYNLRAGFGMPTPEHQDAIYAYYFYRLIQRARNIALVYDCSTGGMRTGERSRFLHQLFYETSLPINEIGFETTIARIPVKPISIEKKGEVERALEVYLGNEGKVLSPSSINEFLNCPLRFYFHYIAGLPQPEEMSEEIDARMFGNIMHSALKNIYSGFGQVLITREFLEVALKEETMINSALDKAFSEEVFGDLSGDGSRRPEGFNLIVRQVLYAYIRQFIKKELDSCPFAIVSLENKYVTPVSINANGKRVTLRIGGIIDRIDSKNGKTRILDYKTGSVKSTFPGIPTLFDAGEKQRNDAAFQVLLYAYVYSQIQPGTDIEPGLFFLRHSQSADFSHHLKLGSGEILESYSGIKQEFEMNLELNLARIVDLKEPFYQTDNLKVCEYCPYAAICRRETGVL
jgi:CRISPR/Cas system-associated exonuclease Cas4 (RecB family)